MALDVRFLGGLEVRADDAPASLGGPQAKVVFALLASDAGRTLSTTQLIDELWPTDPPRDAIGTIQTHIATIRRGLGSERGRLRTRDGGYVLGLDAEELDAQRFARLAQEGRALLGTDAAAAEARLEAALSEWRGEPLVGLTERAPRLQAAATRLRDLHLGGVEDLAQARLELGVPSRVVTDLELVVADEPFRERALALFLQALAAVGRQPEALARYADYQRRLGEELGVDPSAELQRVHLELVGATSRGSADAAAPDVERARAGRLPSLLTRFFGREGDLDALTGLLGQERLVTIVGVGGGGKTRLAVEVAQRAIEAFSDGVHFVDLAPVRSGGSVPRAVADALGVTVVAYGGSVQEQVVRAIGDRRMLVVLDNCEHLLGACADHVLRLLDDCRNLTVLATSREPLGTEGERRWRLDPLALPEGDAPDEAASLQLLVDRAQAVRRDFRVTEDNRAAVVAICRQLDGLPLALELIAARLEALSPPEIAERLTAHRDALIRGQRRVPRHRTLEATIGWSYDLLSETEQAIFRRLSVFVGGATLDAVTAVTAVTAVAGGSREASEVLELVASLVRRSLVTVTEADGTSRYGLLETVREFARQRLRAAGEEEAVSRAHRDHYLADLEAVPWDQRMFSLHSAAPRLHVEFGNLSAAFHTSIARGERDTAARLAVGAPALIISSQRWDELDRWLTELWGVRPAELSFPDRVGRAVRPEHLLHHFWLEAWRITWSTDELQEVVALLRAGADRLPGASPARICIEHLVGIGELLIGGAGLDDAIRRLRERADAARDVDAPLLHANILEDGALAQLLAGRYADALATLQEFPVFEVAVHNAKALSTLAAAQHLAGDHEGAIRTMHRNLGSAHPAARSLILVFLAIAMAGAGDLDVARELLRRSRQEYDLLPWRHPRSINDVLVGLGSCAVLEGRKDVGARLLAAAGVRAGEFKPLTAYHVHYTKLAGSPPDQEALPEPWDTEGLEALVDEELLRWAREGSPDASPVASAEPGGRAAIS
jgi:predicted ATPase/DNA-binding SARP family transcriptional activator